MKRLECSLEWTAHLRRRANARRTDRDVGLCLGTVDEAARGVGRAARTPEAGTTRAVKRCVSAARPRLAHINGAPANAMLWTAERAHADQVPHAPDTPKAPRPQVHTATASGGANAARMMSPAQRVPRKTETNAARI